MRNILKRFWDAVSNNGLEHIQQDYLRNKLVIGNRLACLVMGICLLYSIPAAIYIDWVIFLAMLAAILGFCLALYLMRIGWFMLARLLALTTLGIILPFTIAFYVWPPAEYIYPETKLLQFVLVIVPLVIFDLRERRPLAVAMVMVLVSYFMPVPISRWMGITEQTASKDPFNIINAINLVVSFTVLISVVLHVQHVSLKRELQHAAIAEDMKMQSRNFHLQETSLKEEANEQAKSRHELETLIRELQEQNRKLCD